MTLRLLPAIVMALALIAGSTSCGVFRGRKRLPPVPVGTQPAPSKPEEAKVEPPKPEPVKPEPQVSQLPPPVEPPKPVVEPPKPVAEAPKPEPPPIKKPSPFPSPQPQHPPAPTPQLTPILTADQKQSYNRSIDQSLARARRALASIGGRNLTADQRATADRVRTFLAQAEDARKRDLVRAKGLADRADLLAQDLLKSVM